MQSTSHGTWHKEDAHQSQSFLPELVSQLPLLFLLSWFILNVLILQS